MSKPGYKIITTNAGRLAGWPKNLLAALMLDFKVFIN